MRWICVAVILTAIPIAGCDKDKQKRKIETPAGERPSDTLLYAERDIEFAMYWRKIGVDADGNTLALVYTKIGGGVNASWVRTRMESRLTIAVDYFAGQERRATVLTNVERESNYYMEFALSPVKK